MSYKNVIHSLMLVVLISTISLAQVKTLAFKSGQLKNLRVKDAYDTKWPQLQIDLNEIKVNANAFDIYLRAFKYEKILEIWVKNQSEVRYKLFKTYDICASSGDLGPKRKEGDNQVPEGFYRIDVFNPKSKYHLSMKISYPNSSDILLKEGISPGGAIMMHGKCETIGCLPMTDEKIKELYVLCLEARNRNNPIYIDIFPAKFNPENMEMLVSNYPKSKIKFWKSLKAGYDYFETNHWLPKINIDSKGNYILSKDDIDTSKNLNK